jgi:hypothetical protein
VSAAADDGKGGVTQGLRFIAHSPVLRASLIGVAVVNADLGRGDRRGRRRRAARAVAAAAVPSPELARSAETVAKSNQKKKIPNEFVPARLRPH